MVKVFLAEDEFLIRNGIKNSIEWEKEGYRFVGEASDGELALPMVLKEKPDILITDIRMPFMSGLGLSSLVKKELPGIKIVILSGYDEFEYAKDAIHIGVARYLLKPVSSAKLLETLGEIARQILQEQKEKELKDEYLREMRENEELKKMKFFGELVSGNISLADAIAKGRTFNINLSAQVYNTPLYNFTHDNQMTKVPISQPLQVHL
ncbi:MAG: response regulator, partial [Lachnospiraceae bacterium]